MKTIEYTREDLIAICERAIVPVEEWSNRDSPRSHERLGTAWALLKAGCDWRIAEDMYDRSKEREETIWIRIEYPGFDAFEYGRSDKSTWDDELFYLPTVERLDRRAGSDWY